MQPNDEHHDLGERAAFRSLSLAAAMVRSGLANPYVVVDAATDLLADGIGGMGLAQLAGAPRASSDREVRRLLPVVAKEIGLALFPAESDECAILAVCGLVERYNSNQLSARDLAKLVHSRFGHEGPTIIEALAILEDQYDVPEWLAMTEEEVTQQVAEAASNIEAAADLLVSRVL